MWNRQNEKIEDEIYSISESLERMRNSEFFKSLDQCLRKGITVKAIRINKKNIPYYNPNHVTMMWYGVPIEIID